MKSKGVSMNALAKRIPGLRGQPNSAPSWSGFKLISKPQLFLGRMRCSDTLDPKECLFI